MKRYLFIVSRSPYGSSFVLEQLETAMVAAAFDGSVSILLRDDGVWSLQLDQSGDAIEQQTLAKVLSGLPSYEIDRLYVCAPSLQMRGVEVDQDLGFEAVDYAAQQALIGNSDVVIGGQP
jgi:tRNA 2-thiouridine synthesizing protein C